MPSGVFNKIIENKHLFTRQELKKSLNYINDVREKFDQQKP
jgi:hypothetical protein